MRIAMVSEHASPLATLGGVDSGGQNVYVAALASALVRLGHAVTVYTRRDGVSLPPRVVMAPGVVVQYVDAGPPLPIAKDAIYPYVPQFGAHLRRLWSVEPPDIVHSHFWMSALAALAATGPLDLPLVHTYHALGVEKLRHQGLADTSPGVRVEAEAEIARRADRIVATAGAELFELSRMGASPRTLRIVPCGVDLDQFASTATGTHRRDGRLRVVTLSRLVPRKGIDTVIEALARVPAAELVVAGGGEAPDLANDPEALRLVDVARASGVAERVFFAGRVERAHVPALLRRADVVACTPWYEPFGMVPLEAMACGRPVVVSSVGGLIDTVVDGLTGFHVAPREPRHVALALEALRDARVRRRMGRAGEERVRLRYAWPRIAAEVLEVYRGVAGRGGTAGELATGS
jgi:glycosyltransferase involved in cell wall biosynthesis